MKTITVSDKMQKRYTYTLSEPVGKNYDPDFKPDLSPKEMLALGIFGGKYMNDCTEEFPADWFTHKKDTNYFGVKASQPLSVWRAKGWINEEHDPRGWFQWYCRYYMGRRLPDEDTRQIKRWKAMRRHIAQIKMKCRPGDESCNRKQRQALLHWAYDSRRM